MKQVCSFIALAFFVAAYVPYIRSIVKGRTVPMKATWIIWASLDAIVAIGMLRAGTLNGQIVGACVGSTTVAILSLKYGRSGWTLVDKVCLVGALLGATAWLGSGDPALGIVACLTAITIGAIPTCQSAWKAPQDENLLAWGLFEISCVCTVLSIPAWSMAGAAQPLVFLSITTFVLAILVHRR